MMSRRELIVTASQAFLVAGCSSLVPKGDPSEPVTKDVDALRCINVVNFIRGNEPRSPVDLLWPVREQMKLLVDRALPATWLFQYDALFDGPFVDFVREHRASNHEVGFWFEMNRKHCDAAGVEWRGRPGLEWDSHPAVAFTIGYTPAERIKLADAAMRGFKDVWGAYPKSIASWNLDSITLKHLVEKYDTDAFCRLS